MLNRLHSHWISLSLLVCFWALAACVPVTASNVPIANPASAVTPDAPTPTPDAKIAEALQRVEMVVDKAYAAGQFTGVALIAQDDQIIWSKALGMADRAANIPNTPQTIFAIGEIGMQFTAGAILLLEQEGKLSVQDPICDYLDDCPDAWQAITIHHLISHTSGIADYFESAPSETRTLMEEGATPGQLVALFRDQPLLAEPGARRIFGHSGFVLAGLIIERSSGQTYCEFMKQRVFEPLGMTDAGCDRPVHGLALGYSWSSTSDPITTDVSVLYGSGQMYATAEDLFRWNEGLYNGQLLNDAQLQKMLMPYAKTDGGQDAGYGIVLGTVAGRSAAGNGGFPEGYSSVLDRFLDEKVTFVLLGNQHTDSFSTMDNLEAAFFSAE